MAAVSSQVNKKPPFKNAISIALLLLVGVAIIKASHITGLHAKSASRSIALIDCYRAEMLMRLAEIFDLLPQSQFVAEPKNNGSNAKDTATAKARELLDAAVVEHPDSVVILCKKIILEAEAEKDPKSDLKRLASMSVAPGEKSAQEQKLANLVLHLYSEKQDQAPIQKSIDTNADSILKENLSDGWYRDSALSKVYKIEHKNKEYESLLSEIQGKNWQYFFKLMLIGITCSIAVLIGVIVIIYQLFIQRAKPLVDGETRTVNSLSVSNEARAYNWQSVTIVFLAWFLTQICVSYISSELKQKGLFVSFASSFSSAVSIVLIYLLGNGSALLYIYLLAIRPNGLNLLDSLNLRFKVGNYGTIGLVLIGLLGWFAAMPIVLAAYLASVNFLGSSGSSNPIISIVMKAAADNDFAAILLFYFTLGVLAPFCEESLFRGFLYGYLRSRHGVLFSNLLSGALFALFHFDPGAALPLFCLGSIFAYLREKTGSIVPSIVAHGLWNSATFTVVLLLFGS